MIEHFLQKLSEKKIKVYDFKQIKIKEELGEGSNGHVYKSEYKNRNLAVKKIKWK